jgi:hypothetical protein
VVWGIRDVLAVVIVCLEQSYDGKVCGGGTQCVCVGGGY